jgi:hypothetical protein
MRFVANGLNTAVPGNVLPIQNLGQLALVRDG